MELSISDLVEQVKKVDNLVYFYDVMAVISKYYHYQQSLFTNGELVNEAGANEGSCKIFSFAKIQKLSEQETLSCFGQFYRDDVLKNPSGDDHGNIRSFIKNSWSGIRFNQTILTAK